MRGVGLSDHALLPGELKYVNLPTLLVVSDKDYITRADMQRDATAKWVKQLRTEELSCGHWVQLELPDKVNQLLEGFANEIDASTHG